ncbi:hypothetical protein AAHC03_01530 [Spirometra sp. Aus1]
MIHTTHVIFEREGILVDCEGVPATSHGYVFKRRNRHCPQELRKKFEGANLCSSAEVLSEGLSTPIRKNNFQDCLRSVLVAESWRDAKIKVGVPELIQHLKTTNIPMAVVSSVHSSAPQMHSPKLAGLWSEFSHTICSNDPDLFFPPPEPDLFVLACHRFKDRPRIGRNILAFVASMDFAKAAMSAGLMVVWVMDSNKITPSIKQSLSYQLRTRVTFISSLTDFKPSVFGMPRYQKESSQERHMTFSDQA